MEKSTVSVREGTERDIERVAEIKVRSWQQTYGPLLPTDVLRPFLDRPAAVASLRKSSAAPGTILLVAEDRPGDLIGFSLAFLDRPPEPWLESLHVLAEHQGRGAGTLLMRATAAEVKRRGGRSMRLGVVQGNSQAEHFYERLGGMSEGFEPASWAGTVMHHLYRWPDLDALA